MHELQRAAAAQGRKEKPARSTSTKLHYLRMCPSAWPLHTPLGGCRRSSREGEGPLGVFDWGIIIRARTLEPGLDGAECLPDFTEGRPVICLVRYAPLAEPAHRVCSLRPCPVHGSMCVKAYFSSSNQVSTLQQLQLCRCQTPGLPTPTTLQQDSCHKHSSQQNAKATVLKEGIGPHA